MSHCFLRDMTTDELRSLYEAVTGQRVARFESRRTAMKRCGTTLAEKYNVVLASTGDLVYAPAGYHFDYDTFEFIPDKRSRKKMPEEPKRLSEDTCFTAGGESADFREKSNRAIAYSAAVSGAPMSELKTQLTTKQLSVLGWLRRAGYIKVAA